ncbi:peptidylprolyl isomerase [Pseudodesulfovibrio sp. JC047]|uniref:SurA N-terminal domain-containing protein n=1 Tax=Pseudodesulfovibrio sp. JC047 TaxID=2683199 RepID=UPI0013D73434|nr:SurA N-terminal domain-containing protein [Pseudodesulfovibrio sp. JC047]NDV18126.1 peptidylprolyl isomerase [Pseudodesulfovibrio sp. JC047]
MLEIMRENASGWIVKILFAIIIIVFVFAFGMSGLAPTGDPVMATVNDQIITRAEYEFAYQRMAEAIGNSNPNVTSAQLQSAQFKQMVMGELISKKLLLDEAEKLGIGASDQEVVQGIATQPMFKNKQGVFDKGIYQAALRSIRMTPAQFEADFKQELIIDKVKQGVGSTTSATPDQARQIFDWVGEQARIDYIQVSPKDFMKTVTVSKDEIKAYFLTNKDRFTAPAQVRLRLISFTPDALAKFQTVTDEEIKAYYAANSKQLQQPEQVHARHILVMVKDTDSDADKKKAKAKIDDVLTQAKAGTDFATLAQKYSEGPSGPNGGDLGWFGRGAMVPEFEKAAFDTPAGSVSGLVKTQFGWHIIKVEERKNASTQTLDEVKDELRTRIAQEKASEKITEQLDQALDRLISGMTIEEIAKELNLEAVTTEPMPALFLTQVFGLTQEAAKTVQELAVGEAHKAPIAVNGGYMLVEKVEDVPPTLMPLDKVAPTIVNTIKKQKSHEMAQNRAEKIHAELTGTNAAKAAKTYARRIKTSEPFGRQGDIAGLGQSKPLTEAVFKAKGTDWLPLVYTMPESVLVVRLKEHIPASDELWTEQKAFWIKQAGQGYRQEMLAAFMDELSKNADIDIVHPEILQ